MRKQQADQVIETLVKIDRIRQMANSSEWKLKDACEIVGLHPRTFHRFKKDGWKLYDRYEMEIWKKFT